MPKLTKFAWLIWDFIFPLAQPLSSAQLKGEQKQRASRKNEIVKRVLGLSDSKDDVRELLDDIAEQMNDEHARRQSVEGRLTTLVGLTSIAGTVIFGGLLTQATGKGQTSSFALNVALTIGAVYLVLQVCSALWAAISGLARRPYPTAIPLDVIPPVDVDTATHLRERIKQYADLFEDNCDINNAKVTQMAVAHRAMRNFVVGLFVFALLAAYACVNTPSVQPVRASQQLDRGIPRMKLFQLATIGPFPDADHKLDARAILDCLRVPITEKLSNDVSAWLIVGSTDKRRLRGRQADIYGSNAALAMSRAAWVRDHVLSEINAFAPANSIISMNGPQRAGLAPRYDELSMDRSVSVFVWISDKSPDRTKDEPLTLPLQCPRDLGRRFD